MKNIGILGGTFDPIHNGHLQLALNAYHQYDLDEVWFMVAPNPPHKLDLELTDFGKRYRMTELATEKYAFFVPRNDECGLPLPSYTSRTLTYLTEKYPEDRFYFIAGEDSLDNIDTWNRPQVVLDKAVLLVASREDGDDVDILTQMELVSRKYRSDIRLIRMKRIDISSTEIREMVRNNKDIGELVPEKVAEFIWKEKLYTE